MAPPDDDGDSNEDKMRLEGEGGRTAAYVFGRYHAERQSKLGRRLRGWHWFLGVVAVLFLGLFFSHNWIFACSTQALKDLPKDFSVPQLSANQMLAMYYTSKASIVVIFLLVIGWIVAHIRRLQGLRSIHADKAALANTLQVMLESGLLDRGKLCDTALAQVFSPAWEQVKPHKDAGNPSWAQTIANAISQRLDTQNGKDEKGQE